MSAAVDTRLLLQRVPDARKAAWPLLPPVVLPYLALMLGAAVAALAAFYNALGLRRPKLALVALLVGVVGWVGFGLLFSVVVGAGVGNAAVALLVARLLNVGLGTLLAWSQWAHLRGHEFLNGRMVVLLHAVLAAFIVVMVIPRRPQLVLEGLWMILLR